jgi:hypothetical protein
MPTDDAGRGDIHDGAEPELDEKLLVPLAWVPRPVDPRGNHREVERRHEHALGCRRKLRTTSWSIARTICKLLLARDLGGAPCRARPGW